MGDNFLNPVPAEVLNNLKCYICKKYLSVGPIFSISEDEEQLKCGRCKDIPTRMAIKNFCYERLMAFFNFPCSYQDCDVKRPFGQIGEHEKYCPHRIVQCIGTNSGTKCSYQSKFMDVEKHWLHCIRLFQHSIIKFPSKPYRNVVLLLKNLENLYIFAIIFEIGKMYAGMFSMEPLKKNTQFVLEIETHNVDNPIIKFKRRIIEYGEPMYCIKCMRLHCELPYHQFSLKCKRGQNISELPLQIDFDLYNNFLLNPHEIFYSVSIYHSTE